MKSRIDKDISKKVLVVGALSGLFIYAENGGVVLKYQKERTNMGLNIKKYLRMALTVVHILLIFISSRNVDARGSLIGRLLLYGSSGVNLRYLTDVFLSEGA